MQIAFDQPIDFGLDDDVVTDRDLVAYYSPKNIVDDPELTVARKGALLAHWASDIHAIPNMPSLRRGAAVTTSIDAIMAALKTLDDRVEVPAIAVKTGVGNVSA